MLCLQVLRKSHYDSCLLTRLCIRLEAYLVLLAVSIPTLRPILRFKTTAAQHELRSCRNDTRKGGWRPTRASAGNSMLTESHNTAPFERLSEPSTLMNNISGGERDEADNLTTCNGGPVSNHWSELIEHGIPITGKQNDITVSVTRKHQRPDGIYDTGIDR